MSNLKRADEFARFVALELKGRIISQGFTAKAVAEGIGRPAATLNRWLNNKLPLPLTVLCEISELIGVEPADVVRLAYDRLAVRYGEVNGYQYESSGDEESVQDHVDREISELESISLYTHDRVGPERSSGTSDVIGPRENANSARQGDYARAAKKRSKNRGEEIYD